MFKSLGLSFIERKRERERESERERGKKEWRKGGKERINNK
jgi:hypothetical protein